MNKLLKKYTVKELAKLSNVSESMISQVMHGKRPMSPKIRKAIEEDQDRKNKGILTALRDFLKHKRNMNLSERTIQGYEATLKKAVIELGFEPTELKVQKYLNSLTTRNEVGKQNALKIIKIFYNWVYSPHSSYGFDIYKNKIRFMELPKIPKKIFYPLTREQLNTIIESRKSFRDKAIISLFAESGLRLAELARIQKDDVVFKSKKEGTGFIRVVRKGNEPGFAGFEIHSYRHLKVWLHYAYESGAVKGSESWTNIWGMGARAISKKLFNISKETGIPFTAHAFRRTFACIKLEEGYSTLDIARLGGWKSVGMVEHYTKGYAWEKIRAKADTKPDILGTLPDKKEDALLNPVPIEIDQKGIDPRIVEEIRKRWERLEPTDDFLADIAEALEVPYVDVVKALEATEHIDEHGVKTLHIVIKVPTGTEEQST